MLRKLTTILITALICINAELIAQATEECYSVSDKDTLYNSSCKSIDQLPQYPGSDTALLAFIARNIQYPPLAKEHGVSGKVFISFIVNTDGKVSEVTIIRGIQLTPATEKEKELFVKIADEMNKEAVRVISSLPNFSPGIKNGRAVKVKYVIPINYRFK